VGCLEGETEEGGVGILLCVGKVEPKGAVAKKEPANLGGPL